MRENAEALFKKMNLSEWNGLLDNIVTASEERRKKMTHEEIENIFTYHKPFGNMPERYEELRSLAKGLAVAIEVNCPASREKLLAFTSLQQAVMWANAAIAINEKEA